MLWKHTTRRGFLLHFLFVFIYVYIRIARQIRTGRPRRTERTDSNTQQQSHNGLREKHRKLPKPYIKKIKNTYKATQWESAKWVFIISSHLQSNINKYISMEKGGSYSQHRNHEGLLPGLSVLMSVIEWLLEPELRLCRKAAIPLPAVQNPLSFRDSSHTDCSLGWLSPRLSTDKTISRELLGSNPVCLLLHVNFITEF